MKRGIFTLFFLLVILGFFYSPIDRNNLAYNGLSCGGQQDDQQGCERNTQESETPSGGYCYVINRINEAYGEVPRSTSNVDLPAAYAYEGFNTISWKFKVEGNNLKIKLPEINSIGVGIVGSRLVTKEIQPSLSDLSTENCKVFSFSYQRTGSITGVNYLIPQSRSGVVNGAEVCYYDGSSILSYLLAVGAKSVSGSQICPDLVGGRPLGDGERCTDLSRRTAQCTVNIPQGDKSLYMAFMEVDGCGNRIVKPAENGRAFTQAEFDSGVMRQFAQSWKDLCEQKYEKNQCGNHIVDEGEECDYPVIKMKDGSVRELPVECRDYSNEYSSGHIRCPESECKIKTDECRENINGKLVVYGDLRKVIVGDALPANPDTKVYLDLDLEGVAAGKLPKKAVFKTRVEGAGFIVGPIGFRSYKNTFMGGWSAMLAKYAETTPDLFSLIKRAQDSGNFVPTGPIAKISDDGRTVVKVYSRDTVIFDEILDEWIEGWFLGNIVITMNFNADGSAEVITESSITTLENNYNSNKVNRVNVDAATARRILIDMLMRFDLAKSKPLGKNTGVWENAIPAPDVEDIKEMIAEGRYVDGAALPIDGPFDKRVDYINPVNENTSGGTALDYMKKLIEYLDSLRNGPQTSAAEDLDFVFFDTTVA